MGRRYGVSVSHYGGVSWSLAELQRQLVDSQVPIMDIRGCPYPEMARAEQIREARDSSVETLVILDAHVSASLEHVEELVAVAEQHGVATANDPDSPWALECAAIRRDVIEAMAREEERRYENTATVDQVWNGKKRGSIPLASPWNRDGSSLVGGKYLTDGQAVITRARAVGATIARDWPSGLDIKRRALRYRAANVGAPITAEPGSHFALCIPSFGVLDIDQERSVALLERAGMMVLRVHDCPWIDLARSVLAERALANGRGVFFLDHDIQFMPNDVLRLCEQALEQNAVVAGAYCMRKSGRNIIGSFDVPPGAIPFFQIGKTLPAFYSGLGFAAVPKEVLEGVDVPKLESDALDDSGFFSRVRPWFALDCSTGFYAGEDVSFCNRVHDLEVGVLERDEEFGAEWRLSHSGRPPRVFLDSRVRIAHRGLYDYGIEDAGIVVPRFAELESTLTLSRREAAALMVSAQNLPIEAQLAARAEELTEP